MNISGIRKKKPQTIRRLSQSRRKPLLSPRLSPRHSKAINPFLTALAASSRQSDRSSTSVTPPPITSGRVWSHDPRVKAVPLPSSINKSLHLKRVPDDLNNEQHLLNHFSKYGPVEKVNCDINKKYADIHFKTRESAVLAKKLGSVLSPNTPPVTIFWYAMKASRQKEHDSDYDPYIEECEQDEEDYEDNEVVNEGADSVLLEKQLNEDDNAMDTIARSASHSYYLRSLHQPERDSVIDDVSSYQRYNIQPLVLQPLQSVRGSSAIECYEALDQRDKLMRKTLIKETSLRAEIIVGTCPDMCPEKERYEREYQRRLSVFEVSSEGVGVDHRKAVKEYSRSAADKEEPLPHELRPLPVLLMTMDYLCTCIIDQIEDHSDCYQFIWDRTRAITTDITYQQLCELDCVYIIERCVRFHILCRFILCEKDIQSFDPKMNDESLARHLQSLRQLYKDLKTHKEVVLCNEPEMCSYDILLHCTDGNVLNKIEGYSQTVRQSAPVVFAIHIVQAIESNNFVKFFKLVKQASFLSACLLHRYFNRIRVRALKTFNNSHSPGVDKAMHFNLTDLSRILGFSSKEEGGVFCQEAGLHVSRENVQLQRGIEVTPPTVIMRDNTVLSKNSKSYAEVVYGESLPRIPNHTPYCSFTTNSQPIVNETTAVSDTPLINIDEILLDIIEGIIIDTIEGDAPSLVDDVIHTLLMDNIAISLSDDLIELNVGVACKEVAQMVLIEELNKRNKQEMKEIKVVIAGTLSSLYLEDVLHESCIAVAMETIADRDQLIVKGGYELMMTLLEETLTECIQETANRTLSTLRLEKKQHLQQLKREMDIQQLTQYWKKWRASLHGKQYIISTVAQFPPTAPRLSLHHQLMLMNNSPSLSNTLVLHDPYSTKPPSITREEIDIKSLLLAHLPLPDIDCDDNVEIYWNILVIADSSNQHSLMWAWLKDKLSIDPIEYNSSSLLKPVINIKFCLYDELASLSNDEFFHVPVVVMATVPMPSSNQLPQEYSDYVINSLPSLCQEYPTVILTPYKLSFLYIVQLLKGIDDHQSPTHVSGLLYKESELKASLVWLIQNTSMVPIVEWMDVHQYLYNGVSKRFYEHVVPELHSVSLNQRPEIIVGFYNDVLMHLVKQIEVGVVTVSSPSSVNNIRLSSWKQPINDLSQLLAGLHHLQLPSVSSLSCINYINHFTITDSISRTRLLSLLSINNRMDPWVHVLLVCTELLLLSSKTISNDVMIGVPIDDSQDSHTPLHWVQQIMACNSVIDSRKRRRSDPIEGVSAPPTKSPSVLPSVQSLTSALQREIHQHNEYEMQLTHWLQHTASDDSLATPPAIINSSSSTQNEKWVDTVTNMKLKVLQTHFVKNIT